MFCGKCGSHIAEGSICCPVCGRQVAANGFARATDLMGSPSIQHNTFGISETQTDPPSVATPKTSAPATRPPSAGFCGGCGAPLESGDDVCLACGRDVGSSAKSEVSTPVDEKPAKPRKKKGKGLMFVLIGLALLLVAAAVVLILYLVLGAQTPESMAENYLEAVLSSDAKTVVAMLPDGVSEDVLEAAGYEDREAFCTRKSEDMKQMLSLFNPIWGPGWTYEIKSSEALERNEEELETLSEKYEQEYDFQIQDALIVNVSVRFTGKLRSDTQTEKVYLIQMDGKWYLDYLSNPNLFHS